MSLELLWAGWRSEYVAQAAAQDTEAGSSSEASGRECVFCRIEASGEPCPENGIVWRGPRTLAVLNAYPYASGHLLVMPRRHEGSLSRLEADESAELWELCRQCVSALEAAYAPGGVNLGANLGRAAGAGIPEHLHLHALPRWVGDTNFMTTVGGLRVMPESLAVSWEKLRAAWPRSAT
jgi:ATP adenylyltransferase